MKCKNPKSGNDLSLKSQHFPKTICTFGTTFTIYWHCLNLICTINFMFYSDTEFNTQ